MSSRCYRIHGLLLDSEVPLAAAPADPTGHAAAAHDTEPPESLALRVRLGARTRVPNHAAPGHLLALDATDLHAVSISEDQGVRTLRFFEQCEFRHHPRRRLLTVHLDPQADARLPELLLTSNVLASLLDLEGHPVLHASAVSTPSGSFAFIGVSGAGKSTLAAALCSSGHPLVSDDALRCAPGSPSHCFTGSQRLRLRPGSEQLARLLQAQPETSLDHRLSVAPTPSPATRLPLTALFCPEPANELRTTPLRGALALQHVLQAARIPYWCDAALRARQLNQLAQLARSVPVQRLQLPLAACHTAQGRAQLYALLTASVRS